MATSSLERVQALMKKLFRLLAVLFLLQAVFPATAQAAFTDIPAGSWYESAVVKCHELGIIDGYPDNTFRAEVQLKTGEFLKMLAHAVLGKNYSPPESEPHWAIAHWETLDRLYITQNLTITVSAESMEKPITRFEMAMLISNAMTKLLNEPISEYPKIAFSDQDEIPEKYIYAVLNTYSNGILTGYADRSFRGNGVVTRAEACAVIQRLLFKPERVEVKESWDGIFDNRTLFIGDSISVGFINYYLIPRGLIGEASYMATTNTALQHFFLDSWTLNPSRNNFYGCARSNAFAGLPFYRAVSTSAGKFDKVFFLMGSNMSSYATQDHYKSIIDFLLQAYPEADIYIQTVPNSPSGIVRTQWVNSCIQSAVDFYHALGRSNVILLDTNRVWDYASMASDGIHLNANGQGKWYELIFKTLSLSDH